MSSIKLTKYFGSKSEYTYVDPNKIEEYYLQRKVEVKSASSPKEGQAGPSRIDKIRAARLSHKIQEIRASNTYVTNKAEDESSTPSADSWTTIVFNSNRRIHVKETPQELNKMIYGRKDHDMS